MITDKKSKAVSLYTICREAIPAVAHPGSYFKVMHFFLGGPSVCDLPGKHITAEHMDWRSSPKEKANRKPMGLSKHCQDTGQYG